MTPLEALVELTNMGVSTYRLNQTKVRDLPALYETIMAECEESDNWYHLFGHGADRHCDSQVRWSIGGDEFICDLHDRRVRRAT